MKKLGKCMVVLLVLAQLVLAFATMFFMEYNQGAGLYLAIQNGAKNRMLFDVVVSAFAMLMLVVLLMVPWIVLKYRSTEAFFRFLSVFLGFMPTLSMGMLVHLADGRELFRFSFDGEYALALLATYIRVIIPLLILLYVLYRWDGLILKNWHKAFMLIQIPLFAGMAFLPELCDVIWFVAFYLLIVMAFDWWEKVYVKNQTTGGKWMMWLFFLFMYTRGSVRMIHLLIQYVSFSNL